MRTALIYGASVLTHLFMAVGVSCWFTAGDFAGGFVPGSGDGAGINADSIYGGMPGGDPLPTNVVYFATPLRNILANSQLSSEHSAQPNPDSLQAATFDIARDNRSLGVPEIAKREIETVNGPAPSSTVDVQVLASRSSSLESQPEVSASANNLLARRTASAMVTAEASLVPPPNPGSGNGGAGAGKGRGIGDSLGGGGAGAGGRADAPPRKGYGNLPPVYPADALRAGIEGRVVLRVKVDADGRVDTLEIDKSANWPSMDQAAIAAVRLWRFIPARRAGVAIPFEILVPIRFSILGGAE
jgi:protein TonB